MKKEVLKRYFEKHASEKEIADVEHWLLGAKNEEVFDAFLESYWNEHVSMQGQTSLSTEKKPRQLVRLLPKIAVAAAVSGIIVFGVYAFFSRGTTANKTSTPAIVAASIKDTVTVKGTVPPNTKETHVQEHLMAANDTTKQQTGDKLRLVKRTEIVKDKNIIVKPMETTDSAAAESKAPKAIKATPFNKIIVNEIAINKLNEADKAFVLNKLAMQVNFNYAVFKDVAVVLQEKYGVVLELCATNNTENSHKAVYSARYDSVSFHDLMNDMSKQMMFSYTVENNRVKICFN